MYSQQLRLQRNGPYKRWLSDHSLPVPRTTRWRWSNNHAQFETPDSRVLQSDDETAETLPFDTSESQLDTQRSF